MFPVPFALAMGMIAVYAAIFIGVIALCRKAMKLRFFQRIFPPRRERELQFQDRYFLFTVVGFGAAFLLSLIRF